MRRGGSNEKVFPARGRVKAVFDPSMKWQLVEEYGVGSFEEQPDGTLLFEHEYSDDEGLISWMISCRDKVTVIEPESIREKLYEIACDMAEKYATAVSEAEPCGAFERREKNHGKQSADDN